MKPYLPIEKLSLGMGDRFGRQGEAQLHACMKAGQLGVRITPVWNKSNREHTLIGTQPESLRQEADAAVRALGWKLPYHVDADHIRLETVDRFIAPSDFFTIDVAETIGKPADAQVSAAFIARHPELTQPISLHREAPPIQIGRAELERITGIYLLAAREAGNIYRHIAAVKGAANFVTEVSMDETDAPQTPPEFLVILAALADQDIPLQSIAPKFTGRFNKGVDYLGDVAQFEREFNDDLSAISFAVARYGLPPTLKLSVHSGSDKFSLYPAIRRALAAHGAGVHVKTAGTTWLEECIGLAEAGGEGLSLVKEIYAGALDHIDDLCAPYATVIDINRGKLPRASEVNAWTAEQFVRALRHNQTDPLFSPHLRQLLHVGFKIAAKLGNRYLQALDEHAAFVSRNVTLNLFERHIKPLFL